MADSASHSLDLINNSISFFREAVSYAQRGKKDISQWKFATINLVQAMELALKEALRRIHPAFIYEDIDVENPEKTVSIKRALSRLKLKHIGNLSVSDGESQRFIAAVKLRNKFTHHHCSYSAEEMEVKFAEIFAFMMYFYEAHLKIGKSDVITNEQYDEIFSLRKAKEALLEKVKLYLAENDVGKVWFCTVCCEDAFIVQEEKCKLCGLEEKVVECENCGDDYYSHELVNITEFFDYDDDEGLYSLRNNYGFDFDEACEGCVGEIKEKIRDTQFEQYCEDMAMEDYYARKHGG